MSVAASRSGEEPAAPSRQSLLALAGSDKEQVMSVDGGPFTANRARWADKVWLRIVGRFHRAVLARERRLPSMLPQRRPPQHIRDLPCFIFIGALVGAVYGHITAVSDGAPLLGFGGLPRGVVTGVVITGALFFFEQIWARPVMARLRGLPFLPHLAIKTLCTAALLWGNMNIEPALLGPVSLFLTVKQRSYT